MSFRARSRNVQTTPNRRRSLSNPRTIPSSNGYYNDYSSPVYGSYYSNNGSSYTSPYMNGAGSYYGSRESLYTPKSRNSYHNGATSNGYDRYNGSSSYVSPYADRYVSPYSAYDNGVTIAGLSFSGNGSMYKPKTTSNYPRSDYVSKRNNFAASRSLSASMNGLNASTYTSPYTTGTTNRPTATSIMLGRSQSLREHERKSRNRSRKAASVARSLSVSSEKSEGYESGSERTSRSRLGSSSSINSEHVSKRNSDTTQNGDNIDYKALYEAERAENEKLRLLLKKKDDEIQTAKGAIERFTNATTKNSITEMEKRERRALERKLSEMEEELKHLHKYKTENERLRAENRALTRVVSKLTASAQSQLMKK